MTTFNPDLLDQLILARTGAVIEAVEDGQVTLTLQVPRAVFHRALAAAREHSQTLGGLPETHPHKQEESP